MRERGLTATVSSEPALAIRAAAVALLYCCTTTRRRRAPNRWGHHREHGHSDRQPTLPRSNSLLPGSTGSHRRQFQGLEHRSNKHNSAHMYSISSQSLKGDGNSLYHVRRRVWTS